VDERIYRLVMSRPIPDKLIRNLGNLEARRKTPLTSTQRKTLQLVCEGYSTPEISAMRHYHPDSIKYQIRRLKWFFGARNRTHLAALAVAQGYVDL
jgi:DNA-binding CsgD family transcriptional regulator